VIHDASKSGLGEVLLAPRQAGLARRVYVMGILNVTPDSFYVRAAFRARGGAAPCRGGWPRWAPTSSTSADRRRKPAKPAVSADEEIARVEPVVRAIAGESDLPISVDTTDGRWQRQRYEAGASIVNDISGLADPELARTVARHGGNARW